MKMESQIIIYLFCFKVCHLVGDIQARRITHDEKEKIQSEFIADSKLKLSTLYRKKLLIFKTDHLRKIFTFSWPQKEVLT